VTLNEWPEHSYERREYLKLSVEYLHEADKSLAVGYGPRVKECAFWRDYLPNLLVSTGMCVCQYN
jgi:acetylcholinesterase